MIKIRDFTLEIKKDMEIKLEYRDRLINKKEIECVSKSDAVKYFYRFDLSRNGGYYCGYVIDGKNQIVKDLNKIKNMMK